MPAVDPSKPPQAKANGGWSNWSVFYAKQGGVWRHVKKVFTKLNGVWVEVWNNRPIVESTRIRATSTTSLSFEGTNDPNFFETTAKFQFRQVGDPTFIDSETTTSGLDGSDGVRAFSTSKNISVTHTDTYKHWEGYAVGTNVAGSSTGATVSLDCRKSSPGWADYPEVIGTTTNCLNCDGCGTSSYNTIEVLWLKDYCQSYYTYYNTACVGCGVWTPATSTFTSGGFTYVYQGPPGVFYIDDDFQATDPPGCSACSADCLRFAYYYIENCSVGGRRGTATPTSCGYCQDVFGNPC